MKDNENIIIEAEEIEETEGFVHKVGGFLKKHRMLIGIAIGAAAAIGGSYVFAKRFGGIPVEMLDDIVEPAVEEINVVEF